ncbi:MAG: hypothetical protein LBF88_02565 [Planctomycetaceae bacterium]|nr:hypothetical protein [Planctomycetaceae bacterium]
MIQAYSVDWHERVLKDIDAGMSAREVSRKYSLRVSWVYSLNNQYQATDSLEPKKYIPGRQKNLIPYEKGVCRIIAERPDATLIESAELLSQYIPVSNGDGL